MFRKASTVGLGVLMAISLAGCGFFGDGTRASEKAVDAAFAGLEGLADTSVSCQQPLPGAYDCTVMLDVEPDATPGQVVAALAVLRTVEDADRATLSGARDREITVRLDGMTVGSALGDAEVAETFLRGANAEGVSSWDLQTVNYEDEPELAVSFDDLTAVQVLDYARAETLTAGVTGFRGTGFLIEFYDGEFPEDAVAVYSAVAAGSEVIGGTMRGGQLQIVLAEGADLAAAVALATASPSYAAVDLVDVTDEPDARFGIPRS